MVSDEHVHDPQHHRHVLDELQAPVRALREAIPDVFSGYARMSGAVFVDGAVDAKTKELVALAISVAKQCDGCIASHAKSAARRGASEAEVAEVLGVAILMDGGPGMVHAPRAFEAFREFAAGGGA